MNQTFQQLSNSLHLGPFQIVKLVAQVLGELVDFVKIGQLGNFQMGKIARFHFLAEILVLLEDCDYRLQILVVKEARVNGTLIDATRVNCKETGQISE